MPGHFPCLRAPDQRILLPDRDFGISPRATRAAGGDAQGRANPPPAPHSPTVDLRTCGRQVTTAYGPVPIGSPTPHHRTNATTVGNRCHSPLPGRTGSSRRILASRSRAAVESPHGTATSQYSQSRQPSPGTNWNPSGHRDTASRPRTQPRQSKPGTDPGRVWGSGTARWKKIDETDSATN